jgi:hypothetical protein
MKKTIKVLAITFFSLVIILSFAPSETVGTTTNQSAVETTKQNPSRTVVWFEGDGDVESTKKQFLEGDYEVEWQTYGDCVYYADLSSGSDIFSADAVLKNTTYIYGIPAGNHFVEVITGPAPSCPWFITFRPIG